AGCAPAVPPDARSKRCCAVTSAPSRVPWRTLRIAASCSVAAASAGAWRRLARSGSVGEPFRHRLRVRYAECDPQGVVFNAHYLAYFDTSITELWRAAFGSYQAMLERGVDVVVAEAQVRFRSPARFDEQLTLEIAITQLGN